MRLGRQTNRGHSASDSLTIWSEHMDGAADGDSDIVTSVYRGLSFGPHDEGEGFALMVDNDVYIRFRTELLDHRDLTAYAFGCDL